MTIYIVTCWHGFAEPDGPFEHLVGASANEGMAMEMGEAHHTHYPPGPGVIRISVHQTLDRALVKRHRDSGYLSCRLCGLGAGDICLIQLPEGFYYCINHLQEV